MNQNNVVGGVSFPNTGASVFGGPMPGAEQGKAAEQARVARIVELEGELDKVRKEGGEDKTLIARLSAKTHELQTDLIKANAEVAELQAGLIKANAEVAELRAKAPKK